jgi:hypothetical protein
MSHGFQLLHIAFTVMTSPGDWPRSVSHEVRELTIAVSQTILGADVKLQQPEKDYELTLISEDVVAAVEGSGGGGSRNLTLAYLRFCRHTKAFTAKARGQSDASDGRCLLYLPARGSTVALAKVMALQCTQH